MNGDMLRVRYTGWLYDRNAAENKGTQFDSGTIEFVLGAGRVIQGWDRGLRLACGSAAAESSSPRPNSLTVPPAVRREFRAMPRSSSKWSVLGIS